MRRSSVPDDSILNGSGRNIDELIYKFDSKADAHRLQQLLATTSPQFQHELEELLYDQQNLGTSEQVLQKELIRRMLLKKNNTNDSLLSLTTDSDFCSDDQRVDSDYIRGGHHPRTDRSRYGENVIDGEHDQTINNEQVALGLTRIGRFLDMLSRWPWPRMSFTALGICFLLTIFISPRACVQNILFPAFRLVFGTLYPAYASYKAVRTKNVKEYVKWMMYWIVYAFFTCIETFTDIFLSWFPFYYEVKVLVVLWLLSPATKGSSVLYRKFVHPMLTRREQEIDEYLNQAKERGYTAVIQLGSKGVNYATNVIMQTALKGGGNLVQTIRRSYSLSDLSEPDVHRTQNEIDEVVKPQQQLQQKILRSRNPNAVTRSSSGSRHSTGMYFSEIDVTAKNPADQINYNIRSSEDISSGYSSAEPVSLGLSRTSSMTSSTRTRFKAKRPEDDNFSEYEENEYLKRISQPSSEISQIFFHPNNPLNRSLPQPSSSYPTTSNYSPQLIYPIPRLLNKSTDEHEHFLENEINLNEKYAMFCKWLQQQNDENENGKQDDEFQDTISTNSDEDLEKFTDVEAENNEKIVKEIIETNENLIEENLIENSNPNEEKSEKLIEKIELPDVTVENSFLDENTKAELPLRKEHIYEEMKFEDSLVVELKRPANHGKGKAPIPPNSTLPLNQIRLNTQPSRPLTPLNFANNSPRLSPKLSKQSIDTEFCDYSNSRTDLDKSRSSSPKPSDTSTTKQKSNKKSLFKNYLPSLPSIFRSESPKPPLNKSDEDYHRETEI